MQNLSPVHPRPFLFAVPALAGALLSACLLPASAAPGELDPAFGSGGKVTTDFGGSDVGTSVVVQSDGKILVAGGGDAAGDVYFAVARYDADGKVDTTFNGTGKVTTAVGGAGLSMAVQSDGKIVVVGQQSIASIPGFSFALVRYDSAGALDTTFNGTGIVSTYLGSNNGDAAFSVAVQSDGKIVIAGPTNSEGTHACAVLRYTSAGTLDPTFNGTGKVITRGFVGSGVAVQSDGKIVVVGSGSRNFAVVRYTSTGALDNTFGGTGKVFTSIRSGDDYARSVVIQSDGKIVVAGVAGGFPNGDFALVRYTRTGALDTSFNRTGKVTTAIGSSGHAEARSVAIQNDGKIVVAGKAGASPNIDFALVRYHLNGALDTSFNGTGKVTTVVGSGNDYANGVVLQSDGNILVAGVSYNGIDGDFGDGDFALLRYSGDPQLVPTTAPATAVTASAAVLHGSVNPMGEANVTATFEWGTSPTELTNMTPPVSVGSGIDPVPVEATLTGLARGMVYYYRLRAGIGVDFTPQRGAVLNFATISNNIPGIISQPASNLAADAATLNAAVNPNSFATSAYFEWGTTTSYGTVTPSVDTGSGTLPAALSAALTGLTTDQTYHFRAVATSEVGTSFGPDRTFTPSAGAPQPQDDVVLIDGVATIRVLDNDFDPNGDALSLVSLDSEAMPQSGTAQTVGNLIFYTPEDGMLEDEFGYVLQDATGKTAKARVRAYRLSEIRGQYFGVLSESAGTGQLNLEITASGAFSLLLTWQGQDYALKGRLDSDRSFITALPRKGVEQNALLLLELQFDPLSGQITAQLTDSVLGGPFAFDAPRGGEADEVVDAVRGQLYTTSIDVPDGVLALAEGAEAADGFADKFRGSGFASVKIARNRSARFVGQMPDTAKFSAGSPVSRRTYAFYSALYRVRNGNLGSVSGRAALQSNFELRSTSLTWQREADERDEIFNGAFNTPAFLNGDRYTPPTRGQLLQIGLVLTAGTFANANVALTLGGLNPELTQPVKFVPNSVRVVGQNPAAVKLRISARNGTFGGTFTHNASQETTRFSGIFITSPFSIREGRGSFRGVGAGGKVRIAKP